MTNLTAHLRSRVPGGAVACRTSSCPGSRAYRACVATRHAPGNLPTDLSSFVGRREEVHDLRRLLSEARVVSVIGPGGVGKSRLALRVASEAQRAFRDGSWLVELASVSDPSLLPEAVAGGIHVPERPDRDPVEALRTYLADREVLLLLDNCEQLADACSALLAETLPWAPRVRVLATSQEVLGLPGEAVYPLQPLVVPDIGKGLGSAATSPATALFADRAASALNGFRVTKANVDAVVAICRRLDGLPLAIELAAAHARTLSPAQILDRLDERFQLLATRSQVVPARHQSLRAAVEWSYDLCNKPERLVWSRLSVFPATFDLSAAEAVCAGEGLTAAEVAEAVKDLVDRSVLISEPRPWEMRYRLLESIREYGQDMLRAAAADQVQTVSLAVLRSRHFDWYAALADRFDRAWFGPHQHELLEQLRAEVPNIRAALSFTAEEPARTERGLMLAGSLGFFWRVSAMREGQNRLIRLLKAETTPSSGRARALIALGWLMTARAEQEGEPVVSEALSVTERFEPDRVARARLLKGALLTQRNPPQALPEMKQAVAAAQRIGSTEDTAYALFGLGWTLALAGSPDEAELRFRESRALCEAAGELWWHGVVDFRRSLIAWLHGDLELAAATAVDALRASRRVPDLLACADAICVVGATEVGRDDRHAAYLFGAAWRYWDDAGGSIVCTPPWDSLLADAKERCRSAIGSTVFDERSGKGRDDGLVVAAAAVLGERPYSTRPQQPAGNFGLTRREFEIAGLIAEGLTNREIAANLVISIRTAETHVQHVLAKSGFTTRSQVAAWYVSRNQHTDD